MLVFLSVMGVIFLSVMDGIVFLRVMDVSIPKRDGCYIPKCDGC